MSPGVFVCAPGGDAEGRGEASEGRGPYGPAAGNPVRLLIVDDNAIILESLRAILETEAGIEVVGQARTGRRALTRFEDLHPDVTLLDVYMAGVSGLDILRDIRGIRPDAAVLMMSAYDRDEDIRRASQLGASGYVLKDLGAAHLAAAIHAAHRGTRSFPPVDGTTCAL